MESEKFNTTEAAVETQSEFSSKIELRFFRHDAKEKAPEKNDYDILLTPGGRVHAKEQSHLDDINQAVAFGSPRKRTQETAAMILGGKAGIVTGEEALPEAIEKLNKDLGYGSKLNVDPRLNFELEGGTAYAEAANKAFGEGRFMEFLVNESDKLAQETGDTKSSTYSNMAANIASVIKKYEGVASRWDELANDESKGYDKTLNRLFGTHQTIQESFLAKLITKMKGPDELAKFVKILKNQGVGFSEGCTVDIVTEEKGETPRVHVTYTKEGATPEESFVFDENISPELIDEIIAEGSLVEAEGEVAEEEKLAA